MPHARPGPARIHKMPALVPSILASLLAAACGAPAHGDGMPPQGPAEVNALTLEAKDRPLVLEYPARVRGSREVEIRPRVGGILETRNYREGSEVAAGASLFTIDPVPFQTAAARAEADLAAAQARLAQARREAQRLEPVVAARAASQQDLDNALSARDVADADLHAAQARLREARLNLRYTRVEAPIAGIAGRSLPSEGSLLAGPETLLTTVTRIDPVHVLFGLPDSDWLQLQQQAAGGSVRLPEGGKFGAEIVLSDGSVLARTGSIDYTDVRIDPATGTSEARAVVPNPDHALRPGQFVRVRLLGAVRPAALEVPQRAVLEGPTGRFVYVIEDGKAAVRPIATAEWRDGAVVVREGLKAGDRVIVDGVLKIGPGAPVKAAEPRQER